MASRRWTRGLVASAFASGLAAAVNLATEWKTNWWAWAAVAGLTIVGFVIGSSPRGLRIEPTPSVIDERSTRRGWVTQEVASTTIEGAVLEIIDRWPDGRITTSRAFDSDAARSLLEFRSFEVTREIEREA